MSVPKNEICSIRMSCGLSCHNCMFCDNCKEYLSGKTPVINTDAMATDTPERKRGRPKRVQQAIMTAVLLFCFMWLIPIKSQASTVYNGYNYYLGMYFGDSEEDVAKMEQMLLDDGYVCISKGGEYEEWGEFLITMDYYWYEYVLTCPEDYTVYMPLRVVEMAQNSECGSWTVNSSTVVADRYVFHHTDDMGQMYSDDYGTNLGEVTKGTLSIEATVPEIFLTRPYVDETTIWVTLRGEESGKNFMIELKGTNNYQFFDTFQIDRYKITGAILENNDYSVVLPTEDARLFEGQTLHFVLDVVDRKTMEDYLESTTNPHRPIGDTFITDIETQAKKSPVLSIILMVVGTALIFFGAIKSLIYYASHINPTEEENNPYQLLWAVCIVVGVIMWIVTLIHK